MVIGAILRVSLAPIFHELLRPVELCEPLRPRCVQVPARLCFSLLLALALVKLRFLIVLYRKL